MYGKKLKELIFPATIGGQYVTRILIEKLFVLFNYPICSFSFILSGISTDLLWKDHFVRRFKRGARMPESRLENFTWNSWRAQYFERHFHMLIHKIAVRPINNIEIEKCSRGTIIFSIFDQYTVMDTSLFFFGLGGGGGNWVVNT